MPAGEVRITVTVATVLRQFLDDPAEARYGFDLMRATALPSGTLYPILARLQRAGWIASHQEDVDPVAEGRPVRKFYRITGEGVRLARLELAHISQQITPPVGTRLQPKGGHA